MKIAHTLLLCSLVLITALPLSGMDTDQPQVGIFTIPAELLPRILYNHDAWTMVRMALSFQQTCTFWNNTLSKEKKKQLVSQWAFNGADFNENKCFMTALQMIPLRKQWQDSDNPSIQSFIQPSQAPELYLFAGANVNYTNEALDTPLLYAITGVNAGTYSIPYIKLLIRMGANVNHQNNEGNTPLHYAAQNKAVTIVEVLLQHGARTLIKNNNNELPKDYVPLSTNSSRNKRAHRIMELFCGFLSVAESIQNPISEE